MKKTPQEKNPRLGQVGGQALLEGVMMRSGEVIATSVRATDGTIKSKRTKFVSARKKHKICALPLVRGVVSFVESMKMSLSTMNDAVNMLGIEEEESKFEKWLKKKFGKNILDVMMPFVFVLAMLLAIGIFFFLPSAATKLIAKLFGGDIGAWYSVVEGGMKAAIFVGYIALISLMPDIRRTFEYHGAEHKSIFCYEAGEELTVENVKKYKRFHPRCGTSFMFVMILFGIVLGFFLPFQEYPLLRTGCKLLLLPVTMGLGFEFLMYAGKHDNILIRILSAPGIWMQALTTREPDAKQIEVAVRSLKLAMPEVFPDESLEDVEDSLEPDKTDEEPAEQYES